jgi:hypothetical protein
VVDSGPAAGRVRDLNNTFGDTNVIGQAFAAQGFDTAGSPLTNSVTEFLLDQQCTAGYFRLNMAAAAAPVQGCVDADATGSAPDTDATALAVLALRGQSDDTDVQAALVKATGWLEDTQNADGSFGGGTSTEAANANSTGLAGWALGERGLTAPAAKAAVWVRSRQAAVAAPCTSKVAPGAIAYDNAALAAGFASGITAATQDQWRRASAQALPVLQWAPAGGAIKPVQPKGFFKAGAKAPISATGLPPGATVCFVVGSKAVPALVNSAGAASASIKLPNGTATRTAKMEIFGEFVGSSIKYRVLGPRTLSVDLKSRVPAGGKQVITIGRLAPGEKVDVEAVAKGGGSGNGAEGKASAKGTFTFRFPVGKKPGKVTVKVVGQFSNRKGAASFTVVR